MVDDEFRERTSQTILTAPSQSALCFKLVASDAALYGFEEMKIGDALENFCNMTGMEPRPLTGVAYVALDSGNEKPARFVREGKTYRPDRERICAEDNTLGAYLNGDQKIGGYHVVLARGPGEFLTDVRKRMQEALGHDKSILVIQYERGE
ncbi:MAG TPA: hypothetical protein VI968_00015 [archaeon]|nr:hypothetical protein [archaeon]